MIDHSTPVDERGVWARANVRLARVETSIAAVALVGAFLVPLYAIAMRTFRVPTGEWVLELPTELLVVMAIYGAGAALGQSGHMAVGFLVARLPTSIGAVLRLAVAALLMTLSAFITFRAVESARQTARAGLRSQELFDVPVALLGMVAAVGFAGWTLHGGFLVGERLAAAMNAGRTRTATGR